MKTKLFTIKKNTITAFFAISVFAYLVAHRGETRDTSFYKYIFENITNYSWSYSSFKEEAGIEYGFKLLAELTQLFSDNYIVFFFLYSVLTFYFIFKSASLLKLRFSWVLPFYLSTLFIGQQFMQIRQGLASAVACYAVICSFAAINHPKIKHIFYSILAVITHIATLPVVILGQRIFARFYLSRILELKWKILLILLATVVAARAFMSFGFAFLPEKVNAYVGTEFAEQRSILNVVNLRAILLLSFFYLFRPKRDQKLYLILIQLYAICVGLRLGFYDFTILSGRLAITFGFFEIYLLPMALQARFKSSFWVLATAYFMISLFISLYFQVPYIIEDYFKPLR